MADLTTIETSVRYLIGDYAKNRIPGDIFIYENSDVFTLTESNVISIIGVFINEVELESGDYSFDPTTNKLTLELSGVSSGDVVDIQYSYYPNYSSTEIENYIKAAVVYLSVHQYYTFEVDDQGDFYPDLTEAQKNLVAMVTGILIEPDNRTYRLPDISIVAPKDISKDEKIRRVIAICKNNVHGIFSLM